MLYRHAFLPTLVPADKIKLAPFSTLLFFPFRYLDPFSLHVRCLPFASGLVLPNHTLLDIKVNIQDKHTIQILNLKFTCMELLAMTFSIQRL
jgi:hypothetical protein